MLIHDFFVYSCNFLQFLKSRLFPDPIVFQDRLLWVQKYHYRLLVVCEAVNKLLAGLHLVDELSVLGKVVG